MYIDHEIKGQSHVILCLIAYSIKVNKSRKQALTTGCIDDKVYPPRS